jgi:hypothetical protein
MSEREGGKAEVFQTEERKKRARLKCRLRCGDGKKWNENEECGN